MSSWYPNESQPFLGNYVQRQAELLSQKYKVSVLNVYGADVKSFEIRKNELGSVQEIHIVYPKSKNKFINFINQKRALKKGYRTISNPNLLISHVLFPKIWQFSLTSKHFSIPWIHVEHGTYFLKGNQSNWGIINSIFLRLFSKKIDVIVSVSDYLKNDLLLKFPNKKIIVIGNHVNVNLFTSQQKQLSEITKFLHISTLNERNKNPQGIFDACAILLKNNILNFNLSVISDEPYEKWEKYCVDLDLIDYITFYGPKKWENLPEYYHNSDAFILNSNFETFSIVLAEAWCTGTPTITTAVGVGYQISPQQGLQIMQNNPQDLADKMTLFMSQKSFYKTDEISQFGQQFNEENILAQLENLIDGMN